MYRFGVVGLSAGLVLAIYLLRLDEAAGQFKDDGWYLILAKSLAAGSGYNLINLPQRTGLYFYPPVFPILLSFLYRISPHFPRNLYLLKSLSICASVLLAPVVFRLFHRADRLPQNLAYLLAVATAISPPLVMLATSTVMSESVFTLLQFTTLLFAESQLERRENGSLRQVALLGLMSAGCYLTRAIGVALIAAIAVSLLRGRKFRLLGVFLLAVAVCVAPWTLYKRALTHRGNSVQVVPGYSAQFWDRLAGTPDRKIGARDLTARVWQLSTVIVGDDVGALLFPSFYRTPSESGEELIAMATVIPGIAHSVLGPLGSDMGLARATQLISLGISGLIAVGFLRSVKRATRLMEVLFVFSLVLIVLWPWAPMRFLVPLLPIFLYYLLLGIADLFRFAVAHRSSSSIRDLWSASRVAMLCILALFLYDNALYVVAKHQSPSSLQYPDWLRQFDAAVESTKWIENHSTADEIVSGDNIPILYLYAHRRTDLCGLQGGVSACSKKGIRHYLRNWETPLDSGKTVFQSARPDIGVLELGGSRR